MESQGPPPNPGQRQVRSISKRRQVLTVVYQKDNWSNKAGYQEATQSLIYRCRTKLWIGIKLILQGAASYNWFWLLKFISYNDYLKWLSFRWKILAELHRAKHASQAQWVRKIGNPSSRENLVVTSAYERANERPYRLGGRGRGVSRYFSWSPIREMKLRNAIFPWR